MKILNIALVLALAFLSGCKRPEVSCTVKFPPAKNGTYVAGSVVNGVEISGTIKSNDTSLIPDASAMSIDVSGSTVGFPSSGNATLTIKTGSNVIASKTFGWTKSGDTLHFTNPSSIDSWLEGSGATISSTLDYSLANIAVSAVEGENVVSSRVKMYSTYIASASGSFTATPCSKLPHVTCEPL